ncbi:GNAT family N-acetyltransferase [Streptomyces sp. NPDC006134]|uniref:GNAT family N-acetyltransferase n=1 Tax=Streptomyces sp. NPDC006134 TaxID=3154467 RepID=UPI0034112BF8
MSASAPRDRVVRAIRADEWAAVKEMRLTALRDPLAHLAFLETYEGAVARPESYWRERAAGAAEGAAGARQVVAEVPGGPWAGTLTVLMEEAGTTDWAGCPVERRQGHVVGVYVRPEWRGTGLVEELFDAGVAWAWGRGAERVRLFVHEDNGRARSCYRKLGFVPSGVTLPMQGAPGENELELVLVRE